MNKLIYAVAISMFMAGTLFTSCQSASQKEDEAQEDVQDAKEDLQEAQQEANLQAQKAANAEEWTAYKNERDLIITKNENRVAELRAQLKAQGKAADQAIVIRIDDYEKQNKDFRVRMNNYESNQSDWATFKREFNHDMDQLGNALNGLTVNNKK